MARHLPNLPMFPVNAQVQQRKECGVKIKRPVQVAVAIFIKISNQPKGLNMSFLFAIDPKTEETIVSTSQPGSNKIDFIERISGKENGVLFNAVVTLTSITNAPDFDTKIFKGMDKVCQLIYSKHKEIV